MTKRRLTLYLDEALVERSRLLASKQGVSLSQLLGKVIESIANEASLDERVDMEMSEEEAMELALEGQRWARRRK